MLLDCPMIEVLAPTLCNGSLPFEAISQATTGFPATTKRKGQLRFIVDRLDLLMAYCGKLDES
jgi:hypothetical protein